MKKLTLLTLTFSLVAPATYAAQKATQKSLLTDTQESELRSKPKEKLTEAEHEALREKNLSVLDGFIREKNEDGEIEFIDQEANAQAKEFQEGLDADIKELEAIQESPYRAKLFAEYQARKAEEAKRDAAKREEAQNQALAHIERCRAARQGHQNFKAGKITEEEYIALEQAAWGKRWRGSVIASALEPQTRRVPKQPAQKEDGKNPSASTHAVQAAQNFSCAQPGCGKQGQFQRCSSCKAVYYCSPEHQKQDWATHKLQCTKKTS